MKMKLNTNPSSKRKRAVNSHSARHDMCWLDSAISDCREKEKEQLTLKQHEGTRKIFRNKHIGSEVKLHLPSCRWSLKPFQKRMKGVARWPLTSAFHSGASPSGGDFTPKTKDPACWLSLLLLFIIQFLLKSLLCGKLNPFLGKIYRFFPRLPCCSAMHRGSSILHVAWRVISGRPLSPTGLIWTLYVRRERW